MKTKTSVSVGLLFALGLSGCGPAADASAESETESPLAIAIHGGAGTITRENMSAQREAEFDAALREATEAGYAILEAGGDSVDAVIAAVQVMEGNPLFNAGIGAVYTYQGEHELDASIMRGDSREAGAVAGVKTVESPIALAREIMQNSRHVMLSGEGASQFAREQGLSEVENNHFNSEHRYQQLQDALKELERSQQAGEQIASNPNWDPNFNMGTVGAVALDSAGNLAAATSTGGMTAKQYGRIGDSPIIGAGTWADNESCAVSSTGHGEYFIRYQVAADICSRVLYQDKDIVTAGDEVIHQVLPSAGGTGGVIIVDNKGNVHMPFNTEGMYRASKTSSQPLTVGIYNDEE
ncbi:isoaspartyl peptidase/L-asparaginase family protein [Aliidiomarina soli]|uniref:Isoaspartyl peptidase n=1 Tax=Aliidiomarina soli TaxID=1928574 RepID=A0A432WMW9_9GAMM|nr:isoaspartyl peptidase/L-asparaginase [Aliidiomarina soli]RUO35039.1 beta-aspartyl-peptidase [Aliidiomarina soli]